MKVKRQLDKNGNQIKYRLIDYFYNDKKNSIVLLIQLINQKEIKEMLPRVLLSDDEIVSSMCQLEVRLITYLECKQRFDCMYKVEGQIIDEDFTKSQITIRNLETNKVQNKTILEVGGDNNIINKLSSQDAFRLGYLTGTASVLNEGIRE